MNRISLLFSAIAVTSSLAAANGYDGQFDLYSGWRQDDFVWSIQGMGSPDLVTKMNWKEMQSVIVGARGYLAGWDRIYVRAQADGGVILQGEPIKTVSLNDNKILTQTKAKRAGNKVFDAKGAIGFHILPNCGPVDIAFCAGFAFQGQNFRMNNPCLVKAPFPLRPFCIDKLNNHYHARWKSGFIGLDNYWNICDHWSIGIQGELHWAAYRGCGSWDWNKLRTDCCDKKLPIIHHLHHHFVEIRWNDSASGWGQLISGNVNYSAWNGWSFGLMGGYQTFKTRIGEHCVTRYRHRFPASHANVVSLPHFQCRLNPIHWRNFFISFNLGCQF